MCLSDNASVSDPAWLVQPAPTVRAACKAAVQSPGPAAAAALECRPSNRTGRPVVRKADFEAAAEGKLLRV